MLVFLANIIMVVKVSRLLLCYVSWASSSFSLISSFLSSYNLPLSSSLLSLSSPSLCLSCCSWPLRCCHYLYHCRRHPCPFHCHQHLCHFHPCRHRQCLHRDCHRSCRCCRHCHCHCRHLRCLRRRGCCGRGRGWIGLHGTHGARIILAWEYYLVPVKGEQKEEKEGRLKERERKERESKEIVERGKTMIVLPPSSSFVLHSFIQSFIRSFIHSFNWVRLNLLPWLPRSHDHPPPLRPASYSLILSALDFWLRYGQSKRAFICR